jgi:hypothetical protein
LDGTNEKQPQILRLRFASLRMTNFAVAVVDQPRRL